MIRYDKAMENMMNLNLINPLLEANNVEFAGIFGSFARGESKVSSDVDILVKFKTPISLLGLIRLERQISEKIGKEVDLVTEDSLSPFIKKEVLQDLKLIYEKR
jgi:uncharacterized protein